MNISEKKKRETAIDFIAHAMGQYRCAKGRFFRFSTGLTKKLLRSPRGASKSGYIVRGVLRVY